MTAQPHRVVGTADVAANRRRGGELRILLSPLAPRPGLGHVDTEATDPGRVGTGSAR
ncbi:hypothetical protein AB0425_38285 [Actinosynnema sp. NPDC051121]